MHTLIDICDYSHKIRAKKTKQMKLYVYINNKVGKGDDRTNNSWLYRTTPKFTPKSNVAHYLWL